MKGINNSVRVQKLIGSRISAARNYAGLSRKQFAELLMGDTEFPEITPRKTCSEITTPIEKLVSRIKQWELGENPVGLEFIPAICNVLHCDVGYLFGDYDEHYHFVADISAITGLSELNVGRLMMWQDHFGKKLDNVANICIESAFQSLADFIMLDIARKDLIESSKNDSGYTDAMTEDDIISNVAKFWNISEKAKEHGLTTLQHKDAIKFYARSIANTLERYLEEVYTNGID